MNDYDPLLLKNQICFPLYALSREINKKYYPYLDELDLTYTKYIIMLVLWENNKITLKELSNKLYLDSGTLTPVLKDMEKANLLKRYRDTVDERVLNVSITKKGLELKEKCQNIPFEVGGCLNLKSEELKTLYTLLYKALDKLR